MKVSCEKFIAMAYELLGNPYLWGGNGETLEDIIRKYATAKEQGKDATTDMINFINTKYCIKCNEIHFQDCSGLVVEILRLLGVFDKSEDLSAQGFYENCEKIKKPCKGALAFYWNGSKHNHVGICVSDTTIIHCLSTKTGVIIENIEKRADKWVDFGYPSKWVNKETETGTQVDTVKTLEPVYVYNTAKEAEENDITKGILYKPNTYYIYKTYKERYTNITKKIGTAGGWIRNDILADAEEW